MPSGLNTKHMTPVRTPIKRSTGSPTERMYTLFNTLIELNPKKAFSEETQEALTRYPLPFVLAYNDLYDEFILQNASRHTEEKASSLEKRISDYADTIKNTQTWPIQSLNPATLTVGSKEGRQLGEFMHAVTQDKRVICICPNINIPFQGVKLNSTHYLIPRLKSKGQACVDVVEMMPQNAGHYGGVHRVVTALQFNGQGELISNTPPKHKRVYKLSLTQNTFYQEYLRSESVPYLRVKNNKNTLFSMRELPGVNLMQYMRILRRMKSKERFEAWLMLAWKCYEALHAIIVKNQQLERRHGDLNPGNIMVEQLIDEISIKFIDFDPTSFTKKYSPYHKLYRDLHHTPKHDIYALGRVLALALGDTHQIWISRDIEVLYYYQKKPVEHLLSHVFMRFDEAQEKKYAPATVIETLKQVFTQIHELGSDDYLSAKELGYIFQASYTDVKVKNAEQLSAQPCSRL